MNDKKWACFTLIYQSLFAYAIALMVYQFGSILVLKTAPTVWTFIAVVVKRKVAGWGIVRSGNAK